MKFKLTARGEIMLDEVCLYQLDVSKAEDGSTETAIKLVKMFSDERISLIKVNLRIIELGDYAVTSIQTSVTVILVDNSTKVVLSSANFLWPKEPIQDHEILDYIAF